MRRRDFLGALSGLAIARSIPAAGQHAERMRRIGILLGGAADDPLYKTYVAALSRGLKNFGWEEGRNIQIDMRGSAADPASTRALAAEIVAANPDVIFASGAAATAALHQATRRIPIVYVGLSDPVGQGLVVSLARPDGNVTGFIQFDFALLGKLLEILKEIAPEVTRAALIFSPDNPNAGAYTRTFDASALSFGIKPVAVPVRNAADIERALEAFAREPNGGLVIPPNYITALNRELIASLATKHRLPAVYHARYFASSGGLVAYGADTADLYSRAASYVDRILRGEKAGDLPVQFPAKFELVVNLKASKAIALTIPEAFLLRADEVIE